MATIMYTRFDARGNGVVLHRSPRHAAYAMPGGRRFSLICHERYYHITFRAPFIDVIHFLIRFRHC